MHQNVRFKKITTKWSKMSPMVVADTLAQAFKVDFWLPLLIPIEFHTHIIFSGYIGCYGNFIGNFIVQQYFINILSYLYLCNFCYSNSRLTNRQKPEVLQQVPMPPSLAKSRGKVPRVQNHNQSVRGQHHLLLLVQCRRFIWNRPPLHQKSRHSKHRLLLNQHLSHKKYQLMCLSRLPIQRIWSHHRLFLQNKQALHPLKVKYWPQNYHRWIYFFKL